MIEIVQTILVIAIFLLTLIVYLHIYEHLKKCNELEIFQLIDPSKEKLNEVCNFRQPVVITYNTTDSWLILTWDKLNIDGQVYPVHLRSKDKEEQDDMYIPFCIAKEILSNDKENIYFSEHNYDFIIESKLDKLIRRHDEHLRPTFLCSYKYDLLFGSLNSYTSIRYETNYRTFLICQSGTMKIKLYPPDSSKYFHTQHDYYHYEFRSILHPWTDVQDTEEFTYDMKKSKFINIELKPSQILFLPAFWWYTIYFSDISSLILKIEYRTFYNIVATLPITIMHWLTLIKHQNDIHIPLQPMSSSSTSEPSIYDSKSNSSTSDCINGS